MKNYEKHPLNIFPNITGNDKEFLKNGLINEGYDPAFPIYLYEDKIIDGWQRYQICKDFNIVFTTEELIMDREDISSFIFRTNRRRNLKSGQLAGLSTRMKEKIAELEEEAEERQQASLKQNQDKKDRSRINSVTEETPATTEIEQKESGKTVNKELATIVGSNEKYVKAARRLEKEDPNKLTQVIDGEIAITKIIKEQSEKDKKYTSASKSSTKKADPFFNNTQKEAYKVTEALKKLLQKNKIPKTKAEKVHLGRLQWYIKRIIELAIEAGFDVETIIDSLPKKIQDKMGNPPKHLQLTEKIIGDINTEMKKDDAEIEVLNVN